MQEQTASRERPETCRGWFDPWEMASTRGLRCEQESLEWWDPLGPRKTLRVKKLPGLPAARSRRAGEQAPLAREALAAPGPDCGVRAAGPLPLRRTGTGNPRHPDWSGLVPQAEMWMADLP